MERMPCRFPKPGVSLCDTHRWLAERYVRNLTHSDSGPADVRAGSGDLVVWRCTDCGAEFPSKVIDRVKTDSCRCRGCSAKYAGRKHHELVLQRNGTLRSVHPDTADEWGPELNGDVASDDVAPSSPEAYRRHCPAGHRPYRAAVSDLRLRRGSERPPSGDPRTASPPAAPNAGIPVVKKKLQLAMNS